MFSSKEKNPTDTMLCSVMERKLKSSVGRLKRPSFIYRKRFKPTKLVLLFTRTVSLGVVAVATYFITLALSHNSCYV